MNDTTRPADMPGAQADEPVAFPGLPVPAWQTDDGDVWVLLADGKMHMIASEDEFTDPLAPMDPADLDAHFGPMIPVGDDR